MDNKPGTRRDERVNNITWETVLIVYVYVNMSNITSFKSIHGCYSGFKSRVSV